MLLLHKTLNFKWTWMGDVMEPSPLIGHVTLPHVQDSGILLLCIILDKAQLNLQQRNELNDAKIKKRHSHPS